MAKIVKSLQVSWSWTGDKYSLRGFNVAVTPTAKNPKEEVVALVYVETSTSNDNTYSYKMSNITLDKDAQYKVWVQAVYDNKDSDWVSTGSATVTDDGSATIIVKTDREIQDIVNMASDSVLTRQEKVGLRREWQEIVYEYLQIIASATAQSVPDSNTVLTNFKTQANALGTYLNGGTSWTISDSNKNTFPAWITDANLSTNTTIVGDTYRSKFRLYYDAKVKVLEEIKNYTVDNVQIGVTNLIPNSNFEKGMEDWSIQNHDSTGTDKSVNITTNNPTWVPTGKKALTICGTNTTERYGVKSKTLSLIPNTEYTISGYCAGHRVSQILVNIRDMDASQANIFTKVITPVVGGGSTLDKWYRFEYTFTTTANSNFAVNLYSHTFATNGYVWFVDVKLEKGNKASAWSPCPDDATNSINEVKSELDSFETTVSTTFKDGIIEVAEAKAIAQHLKTLESTKVDIVKDYDIVYANTYLTGTAKTNLASAKTSFDTAHSSLVSTINTVISDGKITTAERDSVDSTFNTYNSVLGTLRQRLQEANDTIAKAITNSAVSDVTVGGENLLINSDFGNRYTNRRVGWDNTLNGTTLANGWSSYNGGLTSPNTGYHAHLYQKDGEWVARYINEADKRWKAMYGSLPTKSKLQLSPNTEYTFSMDVFAEDAGTVIDGGLYYYLKNGNTQSFHGGTFNFTITPLNQWVRYSWTFNTGNIDNTKDVRFYFYGNNGAVGTFYMRKPQLQKGNKATAWTQSPQDLENAYTIVLTNESQSIPTNSSRVPTSSTTYYTDIQVYKGTTQRTDYTIGSVSSANGITVSTTASRVNFAVSTGTTLTADGGSFTIPITIDGKTFNKTFSWSCAKQGATGATGATGASGADAYTILLSNEAYTFPAQSNGNIASAIAITSDIIAYKGATRVSASVGTVTNPSGLTVSASSNGTTSAKLTITAKAGTALADSGTVSIPITVDGKSFTKVFSWSKSKAGATGATGSSAMSVDINATSQIFKSNDGGTTYTPDTIVLTPVFQNCSFSSWQYSTNGGSTWSTVVSGSNGLTLSSNVLTIAKTSALFTSTVTSIVFRVNSNNSNIYDVLTVSKLTDAGDVEIGVANLAKQTKLLTATTGLATTSASGWTVETTGTEGFKKLYTATTNTSWVECQIPLYIEYGLLPQKVTVSFEYQESVAGLLYVSIGAYNSSHSRLGELSNVCANISFTHTATATDWKKASFVFDTTNVNSVANATMYKLQFKKVSGKTGIIHLRKPKVEIGNMMTAWTPAPEDVSSEIDDKIDSYDDSLTQLAIFNKLTNNGALQGLYMQNSKLYVNASYIKTGEFDADLIKAGSITAKNGRTVFDLDNSRLATYNSNGNPTFTISNGTLNFHDFEASGAGSGTGVFDTTVGSFFVEALTGGDVNGRVGINFDSGLNSAISLGYTANKFGRQAVVDIYGYGNTSSSEGRMDVYGLLTVKNSMSTTGSITTSGAITTSSTIKATGQVTSLSSVRGTTFTQSNYALPIEIGKYIDMHQPNSSSDVDVRLIARDAQGLQVARGDDLSRYVEIGTGGDDRYIYNNTSGKYLALKNDGRLTYDSYTVPHNWRQSFTPFIFSDNATWATSSATGQAVYLGDLIFVQGRVIADKGGASGKIYIGGLPQAAIYNYPPVTIGFFGGASSAMNSLTYGINGFIQAGTSNIYLNFTLRDANWQQLGTVHVGTRVDVCFSAVYRWR